MNAIKSKALKTLKLWVVPQIKGRDVNELVNNLSDEFVMQHRSMLRSANVAIVASAVAIGNGMEIKD